jgi:tRNA threonylcarbamoyladenosine biosynthesis protein TsaE
METLTRQVASRAATVTTRSEDETRELAVALASAAQAGDRIALVGPLGAGKTQFAKGFARGLGIHDVVNSPSFTLMAEYAGRLPMFHQDLYRVAGADEIMAGGLLDERQSDGVTLSEWGERLPAELDPERLTIRIEIATDTERRITLVPADERHARYVDAAQAWAAR